MIKISKNNIKEIGESLSRAGLDTEPLAIYGSEEIPDGAVPMCSIDRCVAKSMLVTAVDEKTPALYMGKDTLKGCCPGSMHWLGFVEPNIYLKYFLSTGHEKFRGGESEYLKANPELFEEWRNSIGKITPPGKYLIIQKCGDLKEDVDVKSLLCFGNGEQIRNLSSLIHFRTKNPFNAISMPWGPACATFVTYPAGMAEKAPKETAFVGPVDPTGNIWFPPEYMAISIPLKIALRMREDLEESFIIKRSEVAYPKIRDTIRK